jgi:plasmid maintenance system antidote protein VapI
MTARELLSYVRAAQSIPSNYALAGVLGVPIKTVQRWNTGANTPDDAMAARLAHMAGLDPDTVVAEMQAERANDPAERSRWLRIAARLAAAPALAACMVAAVILSLWTTWGPDGGAYLASAALAGLLTSGATFYTSCAIALAALALALVRDFKPPPGAPMLAQ